MHITIAEDVAQEYLADVADILGISLTAAYRLFDRDDFPTIRTGMRRKLVSREAFFDWLNRQHR